MMRCLEFSLSNYRVAKLGFCALGLQEEQGPRIKYRAFTGPVWALR